MRILYVISGLKYGGAEKLLYSTCKALKSDFDVEMDLISLDRDAPKTPLMADPLYGKTVLVDKK